MIRNGGDGGQCNNRQLCQVLAGPVDSGAERVAGDVKGHGHGSHGADDVFDLTAQGLVGGDGDGHGAVVNRVGDRSSPGLTLLVSRAENPAPARGHIWLVACTYCAHAASCCNVRCAGLLTGSAEHGHGIGVEPAGDLRDQGQAIFVHGGDQLRCLPCRSATQCH